MELVQWIASNYKSALEIVAMVIGIASVIVRITPTLKDDNILLPIVKFLGKYIALNVNISKEDRPK
jgi:hypothetical protein